MKIGIMGENVTRPSGFGIQTNYLATGLSKYFDVSVYSAGGTSSEKHPFKQYAVTYTNYGQIEKIAAEDKPDVFIMFGPLAAHDGFYFSDVNKICKGYVWLAWESLFPLEKYGRQLATLGENHIVHLSHYAREIWSPYIGKNHPVIPHGICLDTFKPLNIPRAILREKYTKRFKQFIDPNAFVILSVDRNDPRKRHDFSLDIVSKLLDKGKNVQIIFHCQKSAEGGFNLETLPAVYGLPKGSVILTDFDWIAGLRKEELNELYNLADVRLCCSGGEGFGIPTIEARATGCTNVIPNNTTFPELSGVNDVLIKTGNRGSLTYPEAVFADIDVNDAVENLLYIMDDGTFNCPTIRKMNRDGTELYSVDKVVNSWVELLSKNTVVEGESYLRQYDYGIGQEHFERRKMAETAKTINDFVKNEVLVDLGCGRGIMVDSIIKLGGKCYGIEKSSAVESFATDTAKLFCNFNSNLVDDKDGSLYPMSASNKSKIN